MGKTVLVRLAVLAAFCLAGTAGAKSFEPQPPLYLDRAALAAEQLPPAPAAGTPADQADVKEVLAWQSRRTEKQCLAAQAQAYAYFADFFGDLSPFVKPLPQEVADFFEQVGHDVDAAVRVIKDREKRPRPFKRDSRLHPCIKKLSGFSYPSGHAAISRVYALILADLAPQRRNDFITRANDAALNRVIAGVHHPSDIAAGKRLADQVYLQLRRDPAFEAQLERMRAYLAD